MQGAFQYANKSPRVSSFASSLRGLEKDTRKWGEDRGAVAAAQQQHLLDWPAELIKIFFFYILQKQ